MTFTMKIFKGATMIRSPFPLVVLLALFAPAFPGLPALPTGLPPADDLPQIVWNDNDGPAGRLENGTLTLDLEVRRGLWHVLGPDEPAVSVLAFGEVGRPLSIPGPLVRVREGTRVVATVTNRVDAPLELEGLSARATALGLERMRIEPGDTRQISFVADAQGSYLYRGKLDGSPTSTEPFEDAMLGGALIVDEPGAPVLDDELMVIQIFFGDKLEDGSPDFAQEFLIINGRPWPHTKRLGYEMGDTVRWRVLNASNDVHPMHLHGFYFEVESRGDMERDSIYWPAQRRMAVTELLTPWTTMKLNWVPDRPGGWIFHCHLTFHVQSNPGLEGELPNDSVRFFGWLRGHGSHDPHDHIEAMGGLVMGIEVAAPPDWLVDQPGEKMQRLYIYSDSTPGHATRRFGAILQRDHRPPSPDSVLFPGSTLILREGPPATIRVLNHTAEPTQLHWHGLELESYYDGVPGGTGYEGRRTPPIMAGDSFDVVLRTTRPGTYIYHTHMSDIRQQGSGLYGPLIVVPEDEPWDRDRERVFIIGEGMAEEEEITERLYLNGGRGEAPVEFGAGREHRLRFINISLGFPMIEVLLLEDGFPVSWTPIAEDAFAIPEHRRDPLRAQRRISMGQTFDFLYTPPDPGEMVLEIRSSSGRLLLSQPIRVREP
jgi:manganese oxidase